MAENGSIALFWSTEDGLAVVGHDATQAGVEIAVAEGLDTTFFDKLAALEEEQKEVDAVVIEDDRIPFLHRKALGVANRLVEEGLASKLIIITDEHHHPKFPEELIFVDRLGFLTNTVRISTVLEAIRQRQAKGGFPDESYGSPSDDLIV